MPSKIIRVADDFWNIRGSFKIGGVVDIGTHASLIRRGDGGFVFLDACDVDAASEREIGDVIGDGTVEAILNLHPFHTVYVEGMHRRYPDARLYGTARHVRLFPNLPWEQEHTEDDELHELYADDLEFTVPRGVDFVSANENVHFSSVLALHRASRTLHVDDTLMYIRFPRLLALLGLRDSLGFHPTLSMALEKRAGAAAEFREWAGELIELGKGVENLCAAHSSNLLARDNRGASIETRLQRALRRCRLRLSAHERRYG